MSDRKPLVLEIEPGGTQPVLQRLQSGDDLDIPLAERVELLERRLAALTTGLLALGIPLEVS